MHTQTNTKPWMALALGTALGAGMMIASPAQASFIDVYNQDNPPTTDPVFDAGDYVGFSIRFGDENLSSTGPVEGALRLTELTLHHPGNDHGGVSSDALLKMYAGDNGPASPSTGVSDWVGDSINTNDLTGAGGVRTITFEFDEIAVDPETSYFFYFSETAGQPTEPADDLTVNGRFSVSSDGAHWHEGRMFTLWEDAIDPIHFNHRPVFSATLIPEPGSLALLGAGGLMLLRRRR